MSAPRKAISLVCDDCYLDSSFLKYSDCLNVLGFAQCQTGEQLLE